MGNQIEVGAPTIQRQARLHTRNSLFTADPVEFILNYPCTLSAEIDGKDGSSGEIMSRAFNTASAGTRSTKFLPTGNVRLVAQLLVDPLIPFAHRICVTPGAVGKPVCFLPWQESKGTFRELDAAADYFLTGPLSGCHVYAAKSQYDQLLVMHINANDADGSKAQNIQIKDDEADRLARASGCQIVKRLARGEYELPAFVWGVRGDGLWQLFVHELDLTTGKAKNRIL